MTEKVCNIKMSNNTILESAEGWIAQPAARGRGNLGKGYG